MNFNQIGMYKRPMNLIEKLACGWWWFGQCYEEWVWCLMHPEDNGGDFFCHICSDYVAYEEEMYYNGK